jgi:hypothetical protein
VQVPNPSPFTSTNFDPDPDSDNSSSFSIASLGSTSSDGSYSCRSHQKSKRQKKKERKASKIVTELYKNWKVHVIDDRHFVHHAELNRRFSENLQKTCMMTPELARIVRNLERIHVPCTDKASAALYSFILSKLPCQLSNSIAAYMQD